MHVSIFISIKEFIVSVCGMCSELLVVGGVGWQLRGLRRIIEDWPDWISVAEVLSPGPAWLCRRQQGSNQTADTL